ncbi:MAG: hypothetical protein NVS3B20_09420 [Polyangiales bacterium]
MHDSRSLEQAEELVRVFFENAPIGKAVTAPDGSWKRVNTALAAMLGYSVGELRATSFIGLTHPDDLPGTREAVRAMLAGESTSYAVEKRYRAKDNSYLWVFVTTRIHLGTDGKSPQFLTYVLDISERKRADTELRSSETRYRRLFEAAKDGILILDANTGRIADVNPFMTELTGNPREAFLGQHLWEIGLFKDEAASKQLFAELLARDYVRYDDLPLKARDGREVAVEFVSNVYLVNDQRVVQCNIRDISARKRAETELQMRDRAIQAVSQGILITDPTKVDNPIVYASPGFARLTGYECREVVDRNCRFLQGAGTDAEAVAEIRDAIRAGSSVTVELLNFRKDGTPFWNNCAISPVRDAAGAVTNFVGVLTDVTARRQLEAQFLQAQKMEAVGRLAGGIAHDFNNLLSVILSYAEMIGSELPADEPLRADIEEIRVAGVRATNLTRQLLSFSRQQALAPKTLNLAEIVTGMEKMLRRLLGADIELTILQERNLFSVKADPGQVEQIVMNLAVNARDAMPRGGQLTIEVANIELNEGYADAHHEVRAGSYVELAVSDTGSGIKKEALPRIFEPFFTTKEQGKGTGLGLATVFGIVKQSGGHIFVYSEPGKGTVFKVYLPKLPKTESSPAHAPMSMQPAGAAERGHATILLVEDEDQVRNLARTILRRQGYVVLEAPNGGEALLICEQYGAKIDL